MPTPRYAHESLALIQAGRGEDLAYVDWLMLRYAQLVRGVPPVITERGRSVMLNRGDDGKTDDR